MCQCGGFLAALIESNSSGFRRNHSCRASDSTCYYTFLCSVASLSVVCLSRLCLLFKLFDGLRCHSAGTHCARWGFWPLVRIAAATWQIQTSYSAFCHMTLIFVWVPGGGGVSTLMSCVCVCAVVGPSRRGGAQLCALFLRHVRLRDLAVGQPHRAGTDTNLRRHGARCHHLHGENLGHYQAGDDEALPRSTDRLQQTRQLRLGTLRLWHRSGLLWTYLRTPTASQNNEHIQPRSEGCSMGSIELPTRQLGPWKMHWNNQRCHHQLWPSS